MVGQWRELDAKTGCGPMELLKRLSAGTWKIDELREVIRLALIGGGAKPVDALNLVRRYVDERPLAESVPVAQAILMVPLLGHEEERAKPGEGDRRGSENVRTDGSPSPEYTARVQ
jgi:hypothetical protein